MPRFNSDVLDLEHLEDQKQSLQNAVDAYLISDAYREMDEEVIKYEYENLKAILSGFELD